METRIHIIYRPGTNAVVPDALNRLPMDDTGQPAGLASIVVEPHFIARVSHSQHDADDLEM